jgi:hypothetical protein
MNVTRMPAALLPKEHGAYGQMAFPLVTALAVAGITTASLLTAVAIVAGFLAHEPALVLLGLRGPRARRELSRPASLWLSALGGFTIAAGVGAILLAPAEARWSFALPLVPATLIVAAILMRQEKSWHAETAVAITFSLAAVPVCLASASTLRAAFAVAIPFALIFVAGTLAVRTVILRVRGGGDPRAAGATRAAVVTLIVAATVSLALGARAALVSWAVLLAALPGLLLAAGVAIAAPPPGRLKTIGWLLVAASTMAAIIVMIGV